MKQSKIDKIIWETYELLFKVSEPSVDFNELVKNAPVNKLGQKEIPFMDYEIDEEIMTSILDSQVKKYKLKGIYKRNFYTTIYLGCSPKTKI